MYRFLSIAMLGCFVALGCQSETSRPPVATQTGKESGSPPAAERSADAPKDAELAATEPQGGLIIGEPVRSGNLTIFPVISSVARMEDRFTTIDEGLANGTVEVAEVGSESAANTNPQPAAPNSDQVNDPERPNPPRREDAQQANIFADSPSEAAANEPNARVGHVLPSRGRAGADVNRLLVTNHSDKPLYLMPGEIIIGGQQDRTVAKETIIEPGEKPVAIDVFCVEHGRWRRQSAAESVAVLADLDGVAPGEVDKQLAEKVAKGHFGKSGGALSAKARATVQAGSDQSQVWDEVAKGNGKTGVAPASGTFTANYTDDKVVDKLKPRIEACAESIAKTERVVGVIVAINGAVTEADVFQSTPLFQKLWPKLIKTYALDSVAEDKGSETTCTAEDAQAFLAEARQADVAEKHEDGGLMVVKRSSEKLDSFGTAQGGASASFGAPSQVHGAVFKK
jgi:hypothetical protein